MGKFYSAEGVKVVDEDRQILDAVISTEDVDRDDEVIVQSGIKTEAFMTNPIVVDYPGHSAGIWSDPIGKILAIKTVGKKTEARIQFAPAELNERGPRVFAMYKEGFLNAFSIGFKELKSKFDAAGRRVLESIELVEVSVVPIPANPKAIVKAKGYLNDAEYKQYLTAVNDSLKSIKSEEGLDMTETQVKDIVAETVKEQLKELDIKGTVVEAIKEAQSEATPETKPDEPKTDTGTGEAAGDDKQPEGDPEPDVDNPDDVDEAHEAGLKAYKSAFAKTIHAKEFKRAYTA